MNILLIYRSCAANFERAALNLEHLKIISLNKYQKCKYALVDIV